MAAMSIKLAVKPARCVRSPLVSSRSRAKNTIRKRTVRAVALASEVAVLGNVSAAVGSMYFMMSYNEYITHRYYQHDEVQKLETYQVLRENYPDVVPRLDGGGHVEHHAETLDSMMLRKDDKWLRSAACARLDARDPWRGTAFSWQVTVMMMAQMVPQVYPWFMGALHWGFLPTTTLFLPSMLLHALVWNALHPNMHGLPDVPWTVGASSSVLKGFRKTAYFRWIYDNHAGHHVSGGQSNYNVACPLFDHIVGTFQTKESWEDMKESKAAQKNRRAPA